jgi:hypothetical protein
VADPYVLTITGGPTITLQRRAATETKWGVKTLFQRVSVIGRSLPVGIGYGSMGREWTLEHLIRNGSGGVTDYDTAHAALEAIASGLAASSGFGTLSGPGFSATRVIVESADLSEWTSESIAAGTVIFKISEVAP